MDWKNKYLKYKNKYLDLKFKLIGGTKSLEWFNNRNKIIVSDSIDYKYIEDLIKDVKSISEGGYSKIYNFNENILIRTIPRGLEHDSEIQISKFLSDLVKNNNNPHFPISYKFLSMAGKNTYQLIERMDGDITKLTIEELKETFCFEQLLFGLYCLIKNQIILGDVKQENILYKQFDTPFTLIYKLNDKYFTITTKILYIFTDFGKGKKMIYDDELNYINISDLNSLAVMNENSRSVSTLNRFLIKKFLDLKNDTICGFDGTNEQIINLLVKKHDKYMKCILTKISNAITKYDSIDLIPPDIPKIHIYDLDK